jgi:hypothetical protein
MLDLSFKGNLHSAKLIRSFSVTGFPSNIEPSLQDQTSITLNLFNAILQTTTTRVELERSWAVIEREINIQEQWEAR